MEKMVQVYVCNKIILVSGFWFIGLVPESISLVKNPSNAVPNQILAAHIRKGEHFMWPFSTSEFYSSLKYIGGGNKNTLKRRFLTMEHLLDSNFAGC